ncbi:hypothetical protein, partial [Arthrobacter luteolus]|uniref:hypothetical protein n=1 Tax=Arthrobacter luteolus TaxID=98672 RepID=UPI0019618131
FRINVFLFAPLRCFIILFHLSGFCNSADFRGNRSEPFKPAVRATQKQPDLSVILCGFGFRSDQSWSAATRLSCHTPGSSCNSAGL